MTADLDASEVPSDWAEALDKRGFTQESVRSLVAQLYEGRPDTVFPERSDVFCAFHLTPLKNVRVVVLGQDPYPRRGQAHGLAFSVPSSEPIPRSLRSIFSNLDKDPDVQFRRPSTGDLTPWTNQGVLLLNTALTVAEGIPGSHARQWKDFTDAVLNVIAEERKDVAFLLWGMHAIRKADLLPFEDRLHEPIRSAHPAARGRTKVRRFRDSQPFSEANAFLESRESKRVVWDLPSSL